MKKQLFTLLTLLVMCATGAWGDSYTNEASNVTWAFTSHTSLGSTNVPSDAFLSTNFSAGSNLSTPTTFNTKNCKAGWAEQTLVYYKPIEAVDKNAADNAANMLEWTITPATGITFTPTSVSITACTAGGTGDPQVTIYAVYSDNTQETIQSQTNPRRPDKTDQGDGPSVFSKTLENAKSGAFKVRLYFAGLTNTGKGAAVSNIVVTGTVSGTPIATTTYTITAATNNATLGGAAGTATVAENEQVTLGANPTAAGYFVKWQKDDADFDGNTVNPLTVTATADATYTAIFEARKSITFNIASEYKGTSGTGYTIQYANTSNRWTAPQNYYYASEGKTLTAWSDGTNEYTPGAEYTLTDNITVTPVFTANTATLSEITAETTVTWPFATNNGAPTLSSEGNTQYYVQRTSIGGNSVDVPVFVNTVKSAGINNKKGKFVSSTTNCQVNAGTVFKIPAVKGMIVNYVSNNTFELSDVGFTDNIDNLGGDGSALSNASSRTNSNKTLTYTYTGTADYLYLVDKVGEKYPTGLSVTYPVRPSSYTTPTITEGDFNFEHKGYSVTITASEGSLQVSTDGTNYETQTSPYVTYATTTTTYYAKATGNDYNDSDVASKEVTNTFDDTKKYVAWVYESNYNNAPKNYAIGSDAIHTDLAAVYNVVNVDVKDYNSSISNDQKAELNGNLSDADLVIISEATAGASKGLIALKDIVGSVPVLSMKLFAYTYNSESSKNRWGWGTPMNVDKDVVAITPASKNYKVLEGVTFNGDDVELFAYPNEQNHIQYVDSWQAEPTDDVVLATVSVSEKAKPVMHASTTLKYFALGISCDDFSKYNTNAVTIVKNAAAMLIAGEALNSISATMKCTAGKYGTFAAPFAVTIPEGVTAYSVTANNGNTAVALTQVAEAGETLNAGTPVLIYSENGLDEKNLYGVATVETETCNSGILYGALQSGQTIPSGSYVLQTQGGVQQFYKLTNSVKSNVNRCWIQLPAEPAAKASLAIAPDDVTGVKSVSANVKNAPMKRIVNGQLIIEKDGKQYNAMGQEK